MTVTHKRQSLGGGGLRSFHGVRAESPGVTWPARRATLAESTHYVARIFNEMAGEYDHLRDLWYSFTFTEIERVLRTYFCLEGAERARPLALDVGCGTGLQARVLAELGYRVEGIDIADDLLAIARRKLRAAGFMEANFQHADATRLPFDDGLAEVVNCCGPTLSFVPEWQRALQEISRCLKPGGRLLLEVEGKWTLDMGWEVVNALIGNRLGYDKPFADAVRQFRPPWGIGGYTDYPFVLESGATVSMPLKLFTAAELEQALGQVGLVIERRWGLHCLTNVIPSTILHRADAPALLRGIFGWLARLERRVSGRWPVNRLACSLLVMAVKKGTASR